MRTLEGSCHCGAVTFTVKSHTPQPYMHCYCSICRKTAGGGGYAINIMGEARTLKVTGRQHLAYYRARRVVARRLPIEQPLALRTAQLRPVSRRELLHMPRHL